MPKSDSSSVELITPTVSPIPDDAFIEFLSLEELKSLIKECFYGFGVVIKTTNSRVILTNGTDVRIVFIITDRDWQPGGLFSKMLIKCVIPISNCIGTNTDLANKLNHDVFGYKFIFDERIDDCIYAIKEIDLVNGISTYSLKMDIYNTVISKNNLLTILNKSL